MSAWRDPWQNQWVQIKTCVYLGSQWIHKNTYGTISTKWSWGPYCRKGGQFTATLSIGTQVYSNAFSNEDSRSKSRGVQRMGETGKIQAWSLTKFRSKSEVIDEARTKDAKVHFASLMDICHLKNAELEIKHQKYKSRVVIRGDIAKDVSGSYAVFIEQGSSASQMTAAKVMDIKSRLPGCAGQAADAVSAYSQVKMEDAPKLLKIPKSECPDIWIRLPRRKWSNPWSSMEDPVDPLERNLYVILWQDCYGKGNLRQS